MRQNVEMQTIIKQFRNKKKINQSVLFLGSTMNLNQYNFEFTVITNCNNYGITNHKLLRVRIIIIKDQTTP